MQLNKWGWLASLVVLLSSHVHATTYLTQDDFTWGTYIIDQPGYYKLAQDISFSPNSVTNLTQAVANGDIPAEVARRLGLSAGTNHPVPAALSGAPLATQFQHGESAPTFEPGGPLTPNYNPAAYGLGFFAAIVVTADNVVLDLNGFTIEQSAEHALLQRFFSVIELAEAPFIPKQGPANFGDSIKSAHNVVVRNGTIGRSAHHGIHGNGNRNVVLANVDFVDYEVAALALNGVKGLLVANVNATNRKDVPVLGTFSAARFIAPYVQDMVRRGVEVSLQTEAGSLTPAQALSDLHKSINRVYADVVTRPTSATYAQINPDSHPAEYGLFHNRLGLVDGNSYSFLVNNVGVAVNGFPTRNATDKSRVAIFHNVKVHDQQAFINEIVALNGTQGAAVDPVGAVWQLHNQHPDSNVPLTVRTGAQGLTYRGNILANAQALVAKAIHQGQFADSNLDISRNSITPPMIRWVEGQPGDATLDQVAITSEPYLCNGDSMFHVNKGVIGYNISAVDFALLSRSAVRGLTNLGSTGSTLCGDYGPEFSHPNATLPGYGGASARAYAFAGAKYVSLHNAKASAITANAGNATGVAVLTDSKHITLNRLQVRGVAAGLASNTNFEGPNPIPIAAAVRVSEQASRVVVRKLCASALQGYGGAQDVVDDAGKARVRGSCAGR